TICHSRTRNLAEECRRGGIVVVAAGQARFLGREAIWVGDGGIDVGMHRPPDGEFAGKLCGDGRYGEREGWAHAATPVPGGVGPVTIEMLMENTVRLAELRSGD